MDSTGSGQQLDLWSFQRGKIPFGFMTRRFMTKSTTVSLWARTLIRQVGVGHGLKRDGSDVLKSVDRDRAALSTLAGNTAETKTSYILNSSLN